MRLRIEVCKPHELGEAELRLWAEWQKQERRLRSAFLTPEFATAFSRHNHQARVATISDGNQTVAFLPYQQLPRRVMRSFAYDIADQQGLIRAPGWQMPLTALLAEVGFQHFEFDHLVETQLDRIDSSRVRVAASPLIDMSGGWDAWITDKRAKQSRIKRLAQRQRQIESSFGPLSFELDCGSTADLDLLMQWKSAQYLRTGRTDRFKRNWFRDFVQELFETRTSDFALPLCRLKAGDKTVALTLGPQSHGQVASWFPAYDPALSSFSPGALCLLEMVRAGAEAGLDSIDLGKGDDVYKASFKDRDDYVGEGWASTGGPFSMLRRAETAPVRIAYSVVKGSPTLRRHARTALKGLGSVRSRLAG